MPTSKAAKPMPDRTDWAHLRNLPDDEIERMAAKDQDNPATSDEDWADAFVGLPPAKISVHANFDSDVVAWFKAQGRGYQTRMNAVLRRYMETQAKKAG